MIKVKKKVNLVLITLFQKGEAIILLKINKK